jgi:hypothetical protein
MEENGLKKSKGEIMKQELKIKITLNVLPFGSINYKTAGFEHPLEEKKDEIPRYIEPLSTNIERIEIRYDEGGTYSVPKTTAYS